MTSTSIRSSIVGIYICLVPLRQIGHYWDFLTWISHFSVLFREPSSPCRHERHCPHASCSSCHNPSSEVDADVLKRPTSLVDSSTSFVGSQTSYVRSPTSFVGSHTSSIGSQMSFVCYPTSFVGSVNPPTSLFKDEHLLIHWFPD